MIFRVEKRIAKFLEDIKNSIVVSKIPLNVFYKSDEKDPLQKIPKGFVWGGPQKTGYFEIETITPPANWDLDDFSLGLDIKITDYNNSNVNPESLLFIDGTPFQGYDKNHQRAIIPNEYIQNNKFDITIKAFSGMRDYTNTFMGIDLIQIDRSAEKLYFLVLTAYETAKTFTKDEYAGDFIFSVIDKAIDKIDWRITSPTERKNNFESIKNFIIEKLNENASELIRPQLVCTGHSHIDVAWYWQVKHTREKCKRTFSTALRLMDQYPDYTFFQSQAQLYAFIKEDAPIIFERIKEQVKNNRWQVEGGMWVEADCNISSGESLVRQFLYGKKFFRDNFGVECEILWLPDVFGYNANLPQIMAKSNIKYFITTKIGWNQFTRPAYDTFNWYGLDGSKVLATLLPIPEHPDDEDDFAYTYNARITPKLFKKMWKNYRHIDVNPSKLLMTVGHGDGGGGTEPSMLETIEATQYIPYGPVCKMGSVKDYMHDLEEMVNANATRTPNVRGELYLEMHRGTYTSQAKNKYYNRKMECLMHDLEQLYSLYSFDNYPREEIDQLWEAVLLNQFHDILPGSSIKAVHDDSINLYIKSYDKAKSLIEKLVGKLPCENIDEGDDTYAIYNSLEFERDEIIELPKSNNSYLSGDSKLKSQLGYDMDRNEKDLVLVKNIKPFGYVDVKKISLDHEENDDEKNYCILNFENNVLETYYFKITFNEKGQIVSIVKKSNSNEYIKSGECANRIVAYEDKPAQFDAWDIEHWYRQKPYEMDELISFEIEENGPVRGVVRLKYKYQNSYIEQRILFYKHTLKIDFESKVLWNEHQTLLKVEFPFNINTNEATYDIAFGNIKRPTHQNTIPDFAKFEVPAQKWADISQRDRGASLLNDCKYGYHAYGNTLGLTLIKSGIVPDPTADQGEHKFTYSLVLHDGDWFEANVNEQSYVLNYPVHVVQRSLENKDKENDFKNGIGLKTNIDGTIIEAIKKSENNEGIVLRIYEYGSTSAKGIIEFNLPIKKAYECDMMENKILDLEVFDGKIPLAFDPFEIKTIFVKF